MELLQVLTANVRLAALVEELRMEMDQESLEWAQTNARMHLCCHNQHEARREKATLTKMLKAKSLVPFRISGSRLSLIASPRVEGRTSEIFRLMYSCPKL